MALAKCTNCGRPFITAGAGANLCPECKAYLGTKGVDFSGGRTCPDCKGEGTRPKGLFGDYVTCPKCGGSGRI